MALAPRINPLTKFPLSISPPGHASFNSPTGPVNVQPHGNSIIGPVNTAKKYPVTPVSWRPTPYLNKAPPPQTAQPLMTGGLRR